MARDNISPKLLTFADNPIVPSLLSVVQICAQTNIVPNKWKKANVTAIYKKEKETERENYRSISLICTHVKMMESSVASTKNNHLDEHNLSANRQWTYKKGNSTELLLVKMTGDWRKALDKKQVLGVVFIDFKKAFDSVSHALLLEKLQSLEIAGDLWLWIKDYFNRR